MTRVDWAMLFTADHDEPRHILQKFIAAELRRPMLSLPTI
jgi:hypothetical protein